METTTCRGCRPSHLSSEDDYDGISSVEPPLMHGRVGRARWLLALAGAMEFFFVWALFHIINHGCLVMVGGGEEGQEPA